MFIFKQQLQNSCQRAYYDRVSYAMSDFSMTVRIVNILKVLALTTLITRCFLAYFMEPRIIKNITFYHDKYIEKSLLGKVNAFEDLKWKYKSEINVQEVKENLSQIYNERSHRVRHFCQQNSQNELLQQSNQLHGKRWNMYFDYHDKLLVCTIDKVMSTTFLAHFKHLAVKRDPSYIGSEANRDETRDIFYALSKGPAKSVEEASKIMITAAFSRHPFHRLVSAYRDKIARRNTRFFTPIRKLIIETYRSPMDLMKSYKNPITNEWMPFPTPYEFAKYFIDEIPKMGDVLNVNRHFAAQFTQCPFCSLPFDVVGQKETFQADIQILFDSVNLTDKCDVNLVQNSFKVATTTEMDQTMDFFSKIPQKLNRIIFEYYELDFDLFGYDKIEALKYVDAGWKEDE